MTQLLSPLCSIAITSLPSKVMENIINSQLLIHLEHHRLINDRQYGFRLGCSTGDLLVYLIHRWAVAVESKVVAWQLAWTWWTTRRPLAVWSIPHLSWWVFWGTVRPAAEFSNNTVLHKLKYHRHHLDTSHSTTVWFRRNFLPRATQLWNCLPTTVFAGWYDLSTFKKRLYLLYRHLKCRQGTCSSSDVTRSRGRRDPYARLSCLFS